MESGRGPRRLGELVPHAVVQQDAVGQGVTHDVRLGVGTGGVVLEEQGKHLLALVDVLSIDDERYDLVLPLSRGRSLPVLVVARRAAAHALTPASIGAQNRIDGTWDTVGKGGGGGWRVLLNNTKGTVVLYLVTRFTFKQGTETNLT